MAGEGIVGFAYEGKKRPHCYANVLQGEKQVVRA